MTERGKAMPVDATPDWYGTVLLYRGDGGQLHVQVGTQTVVGRTYLPGRYSSHFATCPDADEHRRADR